MESKLGGYFPKIVTSHSDWITAPEVAEVCSVSHCLSPGPEGWIDHWLHNGLGWFDSPDLATTVVPNGVPGWRLFAYRVLLVRYRDGVEEVWPWPAVNPTPLDDRFSPRGFDAVSKSMDSGLTFECSPLSCCNMAAELGANRFCLLDTPEAAIATAQRFSLEGPEPGPSYVVEVLEKL